MVAQEDGLVESSAIGRWSGALGVLHRRIGRRFAHSEARERAHRYLVVPLGRVERRNGRQLWPRPSVSGTRGRGCSALLNCVEWDAEAVRDDLKEYVSSAPAKRGDGRPHPLGRDRPKKGEKSVGAARTQEVALA